MKKKFPKYEHPMTVYTGIKTFDIKQESLEKDNLYGCVEFPKYLLTVDPNQRPEDYKGTLLHEICHIGYEIFGLNDDDEIPQHKADSKKSLNLGAGRERNPDGTYAKKKG